MRFLKINDNNDYMKDLRTGALIHVNTGVLADYKTKKNQTAKIHQMDSEINNLKQELAELKLVLQNLLKTTD